MTDQTNVPNPYTPPQSSVQPSADGELISCRGCSNQVHIHAVACPHCGLLQRSRPYKNKNIAGVLAMLFGAFGVHRFFLGQWWGLFYLLTFWTGIPSIISFVEAIVFWCSNVINWDEKYNERKPAGPTEQTGAGVIVLIVVVVGFVGIAFIGILAAVSIPAYQDYKIRAEISAAFIETADRKARIQKYYQDNNELPSRNSDIDVESDELTSGNTAELTQEGFTVTYVNSINDSVEGKTIEFRAVINADGFNWDCTGGTVLNQHRPSQCRESR